MCSGSKAWLKTGCAYAWIVVGLFAATWVTSAGADRPDVLMLVIDDLRPMLGCYGDTRIHTPNIDRLASESVVFDKAYCQYAKCGTSRLSLMTGLRPDAIDVYSNNERDVRSFRKRRPQAYSIAAWLKQHGYHTQSFGKIYHDGWDNAGDWSQPSLPGREREMWEVIDESDPTAPTKIADRFACPVMQSPDVPDDHLFAGRMTDAVLQSIARTDIDQPRLMAVGYRRPHLPFVAPKKYFDLYRPDATWLTSVPLPKAEMPLMGWFNSDGYAGAASRFGIEMPPKPTRQQAMDLNGYELRSYLGVAKRGPIDQQTQIDLVHAYAACVSFVDAQVGRVLDALEASGRRDETVVMLFADHGWHLGEHSAWGKMTNFEIATRVPLMISAPDLAAARTQSIAELVDLYPTLCELCSVPAPSHLEGESLVDSLRNPGVVTDSHAMSQYTRFRDRYMGRAVRTSDYRYVAWFDSSSNEIVARELYDHRTDPSETQNLAGEPDYNIIRTELERMLTRSLP
tara:strand:+ start:134304 stop:135839 length:1536 start_codon:yes stop_codon:yes gene_type:complete